MADVSIDEMVSELNGLDSGLTDWEVEFVDRVTKRLDDGGELSEAQHDRLVQIFEQRVIDEERAHNPEDDDDET